jgi:hypothetical protein
MQRENLIALGEAMPKKRGQKLDKQLTVRVSSDLYDRIDETSNKLGIDPSDLVRMLLTENMPGYEDRADKTVRPAKQQPRAGQP